MCNHEWDLLGWDYSWTPQGKKLEKNKVGRMRVLLNRWVEGWHWYLCYSPTPRVFAFQIRATWWFSILSSNFRKLVLGPLDIKLPKLGQIHLYIIWMAHEGGGRVSKLCRQPYWLPLTYTLQAMQCLLVPHLHLGWYISPLIDQDDLQNFDFSRIFEPRTWSARLAGCQKCRRECWAFSLRGLTFVRTSCSGVANCFAKIVWH